MDEVDNPALSASTSLPDYFTKLVEPTLGDVAKVENAFSEFSAGGVENIDKLAASCIKAAYSLSRYVLQGKVTSNSSSDIEFGDS